MWSWKWHGDPYAATALLASAALYAIGIWRRYRDAHSPRRRWLTTDVAAFAAGWVILAIALLSPLAELSEVLFSWHMTQHELLMLVCAPLIALGRPQAAMVRALPRPMKEGAAAMLASRSATRLTQPLTVFVIHAIALWIWHLPALYQAAIRSDGVHLLQHVSFVASACLFWWGMLHGSYGRLGYGVAIVYVFATAVHSGSLGALAAFSSSPWYPWYASHAADAHAALADQQLAGVLMWIPSGVLMTLFALGLLVAWLGETERRHRQSLFRSYAPLDVDVHDRGSV